MTIRPRRPAASQRRTASRHVRNGPGEVDGQRPVPLFLRHILHVGRRPDARVVDQDIHGAELGLDRFEEPDDIGRARNVGGDGRRLAARVPDLVGQRRRFGLLPAIVDRGAGPSPASARQTARPRAARTAGDNRAFLCEMKIHGRAGDGRGNVPGHEYRPASQWGQGATQGGDNAATVTKAATGRRTPNISRIRAQSPARL